jgi:hypothetical protein
VRLSAHPHHRTDRLTGLLVVYLRTAHRQMRAHRGIRGWSLDQKCLRVPLVRVVAACSVFGAALGAVIAIVAHFLSHTLPSHYTVGFIQDGNSVDLGSPPQVHPSWWPSLPISIGVGVVIGLGIGFMAYRAGIRINRGAPLS